MPFGAMHAPFAVSTINAHGLRVGSERVARVGRPHPRSQTDVGDIRLGR